MNMLKYKDLIEEGDLVIIYLSVRNLYPVVMEKGKVFQNKYGALKHDDVIGKKFGSVVNCSRGYVHVLFPTPELWTITLPHRTQILYSVDISVITMQLDLKPGSVVCESGTGSGSLSHALARTIAPNGHLYTFDFHQQRVEVVQKEFQSHGLDKVVTVQHRDVSTDGFGLSNIADAVILDLPQPWEVISFLTDTIKLSGGRICSFSPCVEQVQRTCAALTKHGFKEITTIECIRRQFEVKKITLPSLKAQVPDPGKREKHIKVEESSLDTNNEGILDDAKSKSDVRDTFWSAIPPLQAPGHTGYLTFATLFSRPQPDCEQITS